MHAHGAHRSSSRRRTASWKTGGYAVPRSLLPGPFRSLTGAWLHTGAKQDASVKVELLFFLLPVRDLTHPRGVVVVVVILVTILRVLDKTRCHGCLQGWCSLREFGNK